MLERIIDPSEPDDVIRESLVAVWAYVTNALSEDPVRKETLANQTEFQENVNKGGEEQFIHLLKDMAKRKTWQGLPGNSTSFISPELKRSDHVLSPGVFYKQTRSKESGSTEPEWTKASMTGAHSS
jgi:hypothetical protein